MSLESPSGKNRFNEAELQADSENRWRRRLKQGHVDRPRELASYVLQQVSRTFALNIRVLPSSLQFSITLAYLFCRMADTLEDDETLSPVEKASLLDHFREQFPSGPGWQEKLEPFTRRLPEAWSDSRAWDRLLVKHCRWAFEQYSLLPQKNMRIIAEWVGEMCFGMASFIRKQDAAGRHTLWLRTVEELDRYCYYVAGTVGNMLCDLFENSSGLISRSLWRKLREYSVSFGLGLQLTNILKDVCDDMERNVLFLPEALLNRHGLDSRTLLTPEAQPRIAAMTAELIKKTQTHLSDAMEYVCLLPRLEPRIRLFCLWPLFMAADTLILLARKGSATASSEKIKITRGQVRNILKKTTLACWSNTLLRRMFRQRMEVLDSLFPAKAGN